MARGNVYDGATGARDVRGAAFDPPYASTLDPAERVPDLVRGGAGPRR